MKTNILTTATRLSDQDLLTRLELLAGREREATVELVAHLAELDSRPAVYAAQGYGSLFSYCTQALRLSEDAACNRIEAARACRRFPLIQGLQDEGEAPAGPSGLDSVTGGILGEPQGLGAIAEERTEALSSEERLAAIERGQVGHQLD